MVALKRLVRVSRTNKVAKYRLSSGRNGQVDTNYASGRNGEGDSSRVRCPWSFYEVEKFQLDFFQGILRDL